MATMKDVARLAGVSTSTVSHVINKDRFVSEAITAKVEAAIKELNYAPSALARSLKLNQTHTIGMLITASTNPFYSELVRGVERSCFERGYSLVLCNTEGDEQRMNRNLETLMQKRVDGLLLLCTETHQPSREIMQRYPTVPTVMMDWAPFDGDSDLIQDNSLLGGDLATQYLIDKGHTRIACITGPLDKTPARLRLEGYRAAMKRAGLNIPDGYEVTGDFEFNGGFDAMRQLLSHPLRPQAVFTGNDAMAVGVYQALYQAELQVPQDIAVIGYDDIELASFMTPPLTTIHQPKDELGESRILLKPQGGIGLLTVKLDDPTGYGRITRENGKVTGIVEHKDATDEQRQIQEINTGILIANGADMKRWLAKLTNNNAQGEYYITDIIALAYQEGREIVAVHPQRLSEVEGVNNRLQLSRLERVYQSEQAEKLLLAGVMLRDPARFDLRGTLTHGRDVEIDTNVIIEGNVTLGHRVKIGAGCVIKNSVIGDDCEISPYTVVE